MFRQGEGARVHLEPDHESVDVTRVTLLFQSIPNGGTELTLHPEGYSKNSEAKRTKDEHLEGWKFFLGKLQEQGRETVEPSSD